MTKIWAVAVFLLVSSASALAPSPIGVLREAKLVNSAQFDYAHATYSVWNLGGRVPLKGVFGSNAITAAQANQFRTFQLSVVIPKSQLFSEQQVGGLNRATTLLAAKCFGVRLNGLDKLLNSALRARAWPAEIRGKSSVVRVDITEGGYELAVNVDLPAGQKTQCRLPQL